jgi:ribonuclease HI
MGEGKVERGEKEEWSGVEMKGKEMEKGKGMEEDSEEEWIGVMKGEEREEKNWERKQLVDTSDQAAESTSDVLSGMSKLGGRLLDFVPRWERTCGGGWLVRNGFRIIWASPQCRTLTELFGRSRIRRRMNREKEKAMRAAVEEGVRTEILQEVDPMAVKLISPSYVVPKAKGGFRQVLDLRKLNMGTVNIRFKMEDSSVLMELARPGDYATSLDIKSAFNHIPTNPSALYFLSFLFDGKTYVWKGMPFGAKHAPLIFTKIMKVVLKYIRQRWKIRCVGYMDDLLFLHADPVVLKKQTEEIAAYMVWIGWVLSMDKCEMEPKQQIIFLGWKWDFERMEISMKEERRLEMKKLISRWVTRCEKMSSVKVRELAAILGKINFLRAQFPRVSLYTAALNRTKVRGVKREGWNGRVKMSFTERRELLVIRRWIKRNEPRRFQPPPPQATLVTDASMAGWGAILTTQKRQWCYLGDFNKLQDTLTSSNQRETAAVLLALRESLPALKEDRVTSLLVESDNSTTVSNLSKVRGVRSMIKMVRNIFLLLQRARITIAAKHRPGIKNEKADALSRLEAAGDYELKREVFEEGMRRITEEGEELEDVVEVDIFATVRNRKLLQYISPSQEPEAEAFDAFSVSWKGRKVYAHPPIVMIPRTLLKIEIERVEAVLVTPHWPSQPWFPQLEKISKRMLILGEAENVLLPGQLMKKRETKLPPGEMMMSRISWTT